MNGGTWPFAAQVAAPATAGAAGVALAALQPHTLVEIAPAVAVWMGAARLPPRWALALGAAIVVALDIVIALTGPRVAGSIAGATLLCGVLGLSARFMRQATDSRDEVELLLAQLEDAREAEQAAAAVAERSRIARELHDVLAHSLSALAIQLEGARLLARREGGAVTLQEALARAGELAKEGLADARRAVGALRGEAAPGVDDLPQLVSRFRQLELDVALAVEGTPRPLAPETGLALYRAAQEALTNALRYAPAAHTTVALRYGEREVALTVEDDRPGVTSRTPRRSPGPAAARARGNEGTRRDARRHDARRRNRRRLRVEVEVPA